MSEHKPNPNNWKRWAAEAIQSGYQPGNDWEAMLLRYLKEEQPEKVAKLEAEGNLLAYAQKLTWDAMQRQEQLEKDGVPTQTAQELALAELFPDQA